jgi:plasmid stability protein
MAQITLRGMDPEIERKIRMKAKKSGKSLNRAILDMIYQHTGLNKKNKRPAADSLRKLAGGWTEKDASEFLDAIKSCEQVDEEMWM